MDISQQNVNNVYLRITNDGYICEGTRHISREEMKKMLDESGLTKAEIATVYNLNNEIAMETIDKMRQGFADLPRAYATLGNSYILSKFLHYEKTNFAFLTLIVVQTTLTVIACILGLLEVIPSMLVAVAFIELVIFGVVIAITMCSFTEQHQENTQELIESVEENYSGKMNSLLYGRRVIMNTISNTYWMYRCMEERLEEAKIDGGDDLK